MRRACIAPRRRDRAPDLSRRRSAPSAGRRAFASSSRCRGRSISTARPPKRRRYGGPARRARFFGAPTMTAYTVEADVRGREQRRQRGDIGLINERYALVLFGNGQKIELHPWQAADEMTVRVPFTWDADKWYRMKLRVDQLPNGSARVRGKVWPSADAEPAAWTIEKVDKIPHKMSSPGIYGDGISEVYFDNVKVY